MCEGLLCVNFDCVWVLLRCDVGCCEMNVVMFGKGFVKVVIGMGDGGGDDDDVWGWKCV